MVLSVQDLFKGLRDSQGSRVWVLVKPAGHHICGLPWPHLGGHIQGCELHWKDSLKTCSSSAATESGSCSQFCIAIWLPTFGGRCTDSHSRSRSRSRNHGHTQSMQGSAVSHVSCVSRPITVIVRQFVIGCRGLVPSQTLPYLVFVPYPSNLLS